MIKSFRRLVIFLGLSLLCISSTLFASDEQAEYASLNLKPHSWIDDINWHGFLSQSFIATDENNFLGSSSDGSFKSNEAALNASWRVHDSLQFSLQGLYKQTGSAKPKGTNIDYAIMDWRALDTFSSGGGVRLGRLKNPYGFFNETRDVAATNLSILLPESIYIDYLSQLFRTSDSVGLYLHNELDEGTISYVAQYGRPILNDDIISTLVGGNATDGDITGERMAIAKIGYEDGSGLWRTALSYIRFDGTFQPAASDVFYLQEGDITIQQALFSFELNWSQWQFISEIQRRNTEITDVFSFSPKVSEKNLSYYIQIGFQVSPELKLYARRDEAFRDKEDKHGRDYADGLEQLNAFFSANMLPYHFENQYHSTFAKDTTLGFRYSPSFEWSFAMEVHQIDGTYWLPDIENPDIAKQKRYWNMFLAQVAYRF